MTTKVVMSAKVSRESVVPRREKAKKRSSRLIGPDSSARVGRF
jgi:hypothetical protein